MENTQFDAFPTIDRPRSIPVGGDPAPGQRALRRYPRRGGYGPRPGSGSDVAGLRAERGQEEEAQEESEDASGCAARYRPIPAAGANGRFAWMGTGVASPTVGKTAAVVSASTQMHAGPGQQRRRVDHSCIPTDACWSAQKKCDNGVCVGERECCPEETTCGGTCIPKDACCEETSPLCGGDDAGQGACMVGHSVCGEEESRLPRVLVLSRSLSKGAGPGYNPR
jgi:hypothetical protein